MTPHVPYFVRRLWRLVEARRALFEGSPERALGCLRDPALALSARADLLRRRAMEALYRDAAHKASEGRDASVARLLGVAACEDPARADEWRRHLGAAGAEPAPRRGSDLRALLAVMRSAGGGPVPDEAAAEPPPPPRPAGDPPRRAATPPGAPLRFHLALDDGGEFLVLSGRAISLGHARAGAADVPLLADLESVHARLCFGESFHGGSVWRIESVGRGAVAVDGRPVGQACELTDRARVRLARHLTFRFRRPEPASASALVELEGGAEAEGAGKLLLLVPGRAGRVRIGARTNRHLPVAGVEQEVELHLEPAEEPTELVVRCAGGVRLSGAEEVTTELRLPCPPERRVDVVLGARPALRAPFGLSLAPVDDAPPGPTIDAGPA